MRFSFLCERSGLPFATSLPLLFALPGQFRFVRVPLSVHARLGIVSVGSSKERSYGPMHRWCGPLRGAHGPSPDGAQQIKQED